MSSSSTAQSHFLTGAGIAAFLLASGIFLYKSQQQSHHEKAEEEKGTWYDLLPGENQGYLYTHVSPPAIENIYELKSDCSLEEVIVYFRERVGKIARMNPWMFGRLKKHRGKPALYVPPDTETHNITDILYIQSIQNMQERPKEVFVKTGRASLEQNLPLVKFSLLHCSDGDRRKIVVSLTVCHVLTNAKGIYDIWRMLNRDALVKTLKMDRVDGNDGDPIAFVKGQAKWRLLRAGLFSGFGIIEAFAEENIYDAQQLVWTVREIREDWIQKQKLQHKPSCEKEGVPYLSTNDILISWFYKQLPKDERPDCVVMAYELNTRSKNITDLHIGNYNNAFVFHPDEYTDPITIRKAVLSKGASLPKRKWLLPRHTSGVATAWNGFYTPLDLPGARCIQHVVNQQGYVSAGGHGASRPILMHFKTCEGKPAVFLVTKSPVKDISPFGKEISFCG
eukprot:CAMPEP_0185734454 /NCGR_PEP_ID=MMETSP1171-20130828/22534_1 /TAXON_ID=374046 /ORGANISM="Helicotheca tamensis, Strain CCMP826" /LENGTH=449 /DNA_ID=CAMNT_0028404451 /DNA_START=35 /DNA_END=1384 /DNA_ORIENTATION=-